MKRFLKEVITFLKKVILISLLIGIFYLIISSSQKVFIASYEIDSSEAVVVETFNVGMKNMSQSITFKDKSGTKQVLESLVYDGEANPKVIYVYRIGRYKWSEILRHAGAYEYYATDKYVGETFY